MRFTKMHGLGNDYIYVNMFEESVSAPSTLSKKIADRHFGVGSDGLVLICPSEVADFRMEMYNADGSRGAMCGNASRCIGKYVYERGLTDKTEITLQTDSGIKPMRLDVEDGRVVSVCVDMGETSFDSAQVPCTFSQAESLRTPIEADGRVFDVTGVLMGNPNMVIVLDKPISDADMYHYGPLLENHPTFPKKANVEFISIAAPDVLRMRVWERGSGVTMACGSGSCAAVSAAHKLGLIGPRAKVVLDGGELQVEVDEETGHLLMPGPAAFVFDGDWPEDK